MTANDDPSLGKSLTGKRPSYCFYIATFNTLNQPAIVGQQFLLFIWKCPQLRVGGALYELATPIKKSSLLKLILN